MPIGNVAFSEKYKYKDVESNYTLTIEVEDDYILYKLCMPMFLGQIRYEFFEFAKSTSQYFN